MQATYTTEQILAAAIEAEVSLDTANNIIENLVKMNHRLDDVRFRKMKSSSLMFNKGEVVMVVDFDQHSLSLQSYRCRNKLGVSEWLLDNFHEPTTETF